MKYFKKLVGKRIYLSPMNLEDVEYHTKWYNDFNITDNIGQSGIATSLEDRKEWLRNNANKHIYAIVTLDNDSLIGTCGFYVLNQVSQCAEVGILIGEEENFSKGYGTEALSLIIDYGFDYLNLHNIMLKVFAFNERAIQCYKKLGFKEFGRRRQSYYLKSEYHDELYMDILKEEWQH